MTKSELFSYVAMGVICVVGFYSLASYSWSLHGSENACGRTCAPNQAKLMDHHGTIRCYCLDGEGRFVPQSGTGGQDS